MPNDSRIPAADPSLYDRVQIALSYTWHGDSVEGRPPSMSEWFPWPRDGGRVGRFQVRTLIQGISGLGPNCLKDPRIAPLFWQEMAVHLRSSGKLDFQDCQPWLAPLIAECFEKIANGEDCELAMGIKKTRGDRWTSLRDLWARACIIETLKSVHQLSNHQATEILGPYLGLRNGSTMRHSVDVKLFTVGPGEFDMVNQYQLIARQILNASECIAKGPGMDDLATLVAPL